MRIVDWNTMNGPNDATGDANYQTIFQAIGNETVQGNTERIDILALAGNRPARPRQRFDRPNRIHPQLALPVDSPIPPS